MFPVPFSRIRVTVHRPIAVNWKNFDEAWWGGVSVTNLLNGYNVIKQEDTNHPIVQTHAPRGYVSDAGTENDGGSVNPRG